MKILHVAPMRTDQLSGVSQYAAQLIDHLAAEGQCETGLLSLLPRGTFDGQGVSSQCLVIKGPETYHTDPWHLDPVWAKTIERDFGRPDLVHFHGMYYPFASALALQCVARGWKYAVSPHGGLQPFALKRKGFKKVIGNFLFHDRFIREAAGVHVLNEAENAAVLRRYPKQRTFIVPNGVSADRVLPAAVEYTQRVSPLRAGFIGRLDTDHKGIDLLLKALKLMQERRPDIAMTLVLAGNFHRSSDEQTIKELVSDLSKPEAVVFTGPLLGEEKWRTLADFDCFVHTSRYEGMPTSVIEAMGFAKPCLVTPGTNMQALIEACNGGWNCSADPESIMQGLCSMAESRQEIFKRGNHACAYVRGHLTWDRIAAEYFRQIRDLLGDSL